MLIHKEKKRINKFQQLLEQISYPGSTQTRGSKYHPLPGENVYSRVDREGPPISIKLRKEEGKRNKETLASGDRILQENNHVRSFTERSR